VEATVGTRPRREAESPQKVKKGGLEREKEVRDWRGNPEGEDGFGAGSQRDGGQRPEV
jgi:hypothetical protein